jgi:hypothetical protein
LRRNKLLHNNLITVKRFVKENWGTPFLVGFMVFLTGAGFFMSISPDLSNLAVICAFLVAGVVLQLVSFFKYQHVDESEVI